MTDHQANNLPHQPSPFPQEDEISLIDIFRVLLKHKWTILGLTILTTLIGIFYAQSLPSVYEVKSLLLPPTEKQVEPLNIQTAPLNLESLENVMSDLMVIKGDQDAQSFGINLNAKKAFNIFKQNLYASTASRQIFKEMNLLEVFADKTEEDNNVERAISAFHESLTIETTEGKEKITGVVISTATLSMQGTDPKLISEIVNRLVKIASENAISEIIENIDAKVATRKKNYSQFIQMSLKKAVVKRKDRIELLSEQAEIARSLGLIGPGTGKIYSVDGSIRERLESYNTVQYLRGEKSLLLEINLLGNRKSDAPFINSLRYIEAELARLEGIHIDPKSVSVMRVDKTAFQPNLSIKPNRRVIIMSSVLLGLFIGVIAAFFLNLRETLKKEEEGST